MGALGEFLAFFSVWLSLWSLQVSDPGRRSAAETPSEQLIGGHLAAHELSHLLLDAGSHTLHSIMHVPWRLKELDAIAQALMLFTPQKDENMPKNIRARAAAAPAKSLNIHLYNLAGVPSRTLGSATRDAAEILATAGVSNVCWRLIADAAEAHMVSQSVRPKLPEHRLINSRAYFVVIIERGFPGNYLPDQLGYAFPDALVGVNASVFCDRIEQLHKSADIDLPTLLGHALAHEIGHVLLGTSEHSTAGIMKAVWSRADFQFDGLRFMEFTPSQRARIQSRLRSEQHQW